MEKIDIKSLAKELKGENREVTPVENNTKTKQPTISNRKIESDKTSWSKLLSTIKNRKDLNSDGHVYIDSDLCNILRQLKMNTGIKIGFLVSYLIEQFVMENKAEIVKSLKPKNNRYLGK